MRETQDSNRTITRDEAIQDYKSSLGDKLGEAYAYVYFDFHQTLSTWHLYRGLFASQPESLAALNAASKAGARLLQNSLLETLLIRIRKLGSPQNGAAHCVYKLDSCIKDDSIRHSLSKYKKEVGKRCEFARVRCAKSVAHLENDVASGAEPLPAFTHETIGQAISAIGQYLQVFSEAHRNTTPTFRIIGHTQHAPQQLLKCLEAGLDAQQDLDREIELARSHQNWRATNAILKKKAGPDYIEKLPKHTWPPLDED